MLMLVTTLHINTTCLQQQQSAVFPDNNSLPSLVIPYGTSATFSMSFQQETRWRCLAQLPGPQHENCRAGQNISTSSQTPSNTGTHLQSQSLVASTPSFTKSILKPFSVNQMMFYKYIYLKSSFISMIWADEGN